MCSTLRGGGAGGRDGTAISIIDIFVSTFFLSIEGSFEVVPALVKRVQCHPALAQVGCFPPFVGIFALGIRGFTCRLCCCDASFGLLYPVFVPSCFLSVGGGHHFCQYPRHCDPSERGRQRTHQFGSKHSGLEGAGAAALAQLPGRLLKRALNLASVQLDPCFQPIALPPPLGFGDVFAGCSFIMRWLQLWVLTVLWCLS